MNNQDSARVRAWLEQGVLLFDGAAGTRSARGGRRRGGRAALPDPATARFGTAPGLSGGGLRAIKTIRLRHTCQWPAKMKKISVD